MFLDKLKIVELRVLLSLYLLGMFMNPFKNSNLRTKALIKALIQRLPNARNFKLILISARHPLNPLPKLLPRPLKPMIIMPKHPPPLPLKQLIKLLIGR